MSNTSTALSADTPKKTRRVRSDDGALVVGMRRACVLLDSSRPTIYKMIAARELEAYQDGDGPYAPIKITVRSIKQRIENKLAKIRATQAA